MALSKIDVANMLTGEIPNANVATVGVAKGGTGLTSGTTGQFLKFTGSTTLASAADNTGGITMADMWSVSSNFTGSANPIANNWEQSDEESFSVLGSAMSQSSGVFTFPSTGYYYVTFSIMTEANALTADIFNLIIQADIGNGFNDTAYGNASQTNIGSGHGMQSTINTLVDVTNTSNVKVRFVIENAGSDVFFHGSTNRRNTYATFIRLGDT